MSIQDAPTKLGQRELRVGPMFVLVGDPTVANGAGLTDLGMVQSVQVSPNPSKAHGSIPGGHQLASNTVDRSIQPEITVTIDDLQATVFARLFDNATREAASSPVSSVTSATPSVSTSEDISDTISAGDFITISGSTGNDGTYTVASVSTTTITVEEPIDDSTADGTVTSFIDGMMFETEVQRMDPPTLVAIPAALDGKTGAINNPAWWFPAVATTGGGDFTQEDSEGEDANSQSDFTLTSLYREQDQAGTQLPSTIRQGFFAPPDQIPGVDLSWSLPADYQ